MFPDPVDRRYERNRSGINSALQLSRIGGGVGITLSNLREAGAPIKGYEGAASGVMPVMKLFEDSFSYSNQLGQRQARCWCRLSQRVPSRHHQFPICQKENADEKSGSRLFLLV